jgi:hypothetical protein
MLSNSVQFNPLSSPDFSRSFVTMHTDEFLGIIEVQSSFKVCYMLKKRHSTAILTPGIARMCLRNRLIIRMTFKYKNKLINHSSVFYSVSTAGMNSGFFSPPVRPLSSCLETCNPCANWLKISHNPGVGLCVWHNPLRSVSAGRRTRCEDGQQASFPREGPERSLTGCSQTEICSSLP